MLEVHHLNKSRSKRVLWLLEEIEMEYDLVKHFRDITTHLAPVELRNIHPLGKAPIIVDDDITICESGAIMEYIINKSESGELRPKFGTKEYYSYLEWLHFAEGSLALPVMVYLLGGMKDKQPESFMDKYIQKEIDVDFDYIESTLSKNKFFAGDSFTAADIMMTILLEISDGVGLLGERESTYRYLKSMQERDAYKRASSHG